MQQKKPLTTDTSQVPKTDKPSNEQTEHIDKAVDAFLENLANTDPSKVIAPEDNLD